MQTTDVNGKILSNAFQSATASTSQFVKPSVVIDLQDGRHLSNVSINTNQSYVSTGTTRTNHITNPSFENPLNTAVFVSAQSRNVISGLYSYKGKKSFSTTISSTTDSNIGAYPAGSQSIPSTGTYVVSAYFYIPTGSTLAGRTVSLSFEGGTTSSYTGQANVLVATLVAGSWVRAARIVTFTSVPAIHPAIVARLSGTLSTAVGESIYIDSYLYERASYADSYFDGSTYDTLSSEYTTMKVNWSGASHSSKSIGTPENELIKYFNKDQILTSSEYESFTWGIAGAKDNNNRTITASGKYRAMPSDLSDDYKYGWWSTSVSNASGLFTIRPYLDISFDATTINKIKVVTSRSFGQIKNFNLTVYRSNSTIVLNKSFTFNTLNSEFETIVNLDSTYTDINRIIITVLSTKNGSDRARILSVSPMYQLDVSDYVIDVTSNRVRDLHETSLPIAGSSQSTCSITLDNSDKKFNILNTLSEYGKFLQKDIKVNVSKGWKSYSSANDSVQSFITSNIQSNDNSFIYLNNATEFPNGDILDTNQESNYYLVTLNKNKFNEEKVLIKKKIDNTSLQIAQRGYGSPLLNERTNVIVNPNFETDANSWNAASVTIARTTLYSFFRSASLLVTSSSASDTAARIGQTVDWSVVPGEYYTGSMYVRNTAGNSREHSLFFRWINGSGTLTSATATTQTIAVDGNWYRLSTTAQAPSDAVAADLILYIQSTNPSLSNETAVDSVLVETGRVLGDYFDGSVGSNASWNGTANASTSTIVGKVNICTNPSFESDTSGWGAFQATNTRTAGTITGGSGAWCLSSATTVTTTGGPFFGGFTVIPGTTITGSLYCLRTSGSRSYRVRFEFYKADNSFISSIEGTPDPCASSTRISVTATVPAETANCYLAIYPTTSGSIGDSIKIDSVLIEQSSSANLYYEGSIPGGYNHLSGDSITFDPFEYIQEGVFYIEDMSSSTSSMTLTLNLNDRSKFLNDKIIEKGFLRQDSTVGDAIEDLLYHSNYPNHKVIKYNRYQDSPVLNNAVLHFKFNDLTNSLSNSYVSQGLRFRVYQPPAGFENTVKDMQLDALEKELTDLDKALGLYATISPSYTTVKSNVNLSSYQLSSDNSSLNNSYYQGVFDGYYIPNTTVANEEIGLIIDDGGCRLYIDDTLLIDAWNESTSSQYFSTTLDLVAGLAYKIRIEFYHNNTSTFNLQFTETNLQTVVPSSELITNVINDHIGSRDPSFTGASRNKNKNYAIPTTFVSFNKDSSILWNSNDKSISIANNIGNTSVVDSFIRLPYHTSWDMSSNTSNPNGSWTIEFIFKAPDGPYSLTTGSGEYISSWSNSTSTTGIEFFYINQINHGVKLKTINLSNSAVGNANVISTIDSLNYSDWNHVVTTYNSYTKELAYYVNGIKNGNTVLSANIVPRWGTNDFTFGGRGSGYTSGVGVVRPTSSISNAGIDLDIDEFIIYNKSLTQSDVLKRYRETKIQELKKYPFLYGINDSIYQMIQNISFAELGRMYIDEFDNARYDHYYAFYEGAIDQHANVQKVISDNDFITEATIEKTTQINSVVVKVSGITINSSEVQPIWRAPDPTTLGVVSLASEIISNSSSIPVSGLTDLPFPKSGYIVIDNEIIKYSNISGNSFVSLERGMFNTVATSHLSNTKVREVRYFNFEYDKRPSINVKNPFITGILFEEPDQINILHWSSSPFKGNLIIAASNSVDAGDIVFAEGTNPVTQKVSFTSVAGIPVQMTENKTQITEQSAINSANRRKFGLKEITIDNPFMTDPVQAQNLANFIINKLSEPIPILNVNTTLIPTLQLGDRIRISTLDQFDIINNDYWVISISTSIGSNYSQQMLLRVADETATGSAENILSSAVLWLDTQKVT